MSRLLFRTVAIALIGATLMGTTTVANAADDFPTGPIHMVVAYPAGTGVDLIARQIVPKFQDALGQTIVIDNLGGASGALGTAEAAKAEPDGYTIVFATAGTHAANPNLQADLGYDAVQDFEQIGKLGDVALTLAVNAELPIESVQDLIEYTKANPGKVNFATTGAGGGPYFAGLQFNLQAGTDATHVPYNSGTQALTELSNGSVDMMFYTYQAMLPFIETGRIRPIATTGEERLAVLPDLPTVKESGLPEFTAGTWYALYAPAGTPKERNDVIYNALVKALDDAATRQLLVDAGMNIDLQSAEEMGTFTADQIEIYRMLVEASEGGQ